MRKLHLRSITPTEKPTPLSHLDKDVLEISTPRMPISIVTSVSTELAKTLQLLTERRHPNIVQVLRHGVLPQGSHYFYDCPETMLPVPTLLDFAKQEHGCWDDSHQRDSLASLCDIMMDICKGVQFLHDHDLIPVISSSRGMHLSARATCLLEVLFRQIDKRWFIGDIDDIQIERPDYSRERNVPELAFLIFTIMNRGDVPIGLSESPLQLYPLGQPMGSLRLPWGGGLLKLVRTMIRFRKPSVQSLSMLLPVIRELDKWDDRGKIVEAPFEIPPDVRTIPLSLSEIVGIFGFNMLERALSDPTPSSAMTQRIPFIDSLLTGFLKRPVRKRNRNLAISAVVAYIRVSKFIEHPTQADSDDRALQDAIWKYPNEIHLQLALVVALFFSGKPDRGLEHLRQSNVRFGPSVGLDISIQILNAIRFDLPQKTFHQNILWAPWDHFDNSDDDSMAFNNLANLIVVSETEIRAVTGSGPRPLVRADRVNDIVKELWGELGSAILTALQDVIRDSDIERTLKLDDGAVVSIDARVGYIEIMGVCDETTWRAVTDVVSWITQSMHTGTEEGLVVTWNRKITTQEHYLDSLSDPRPDWIKQTMKGRTSTEWLKYLQNRMSTLTGARQDVANRQLCNLHFVEISGTSLEALRADCYRLCWTSLFDRVSVIHYTFPLERVSSLDHYGQGLLITFELLVTIAGIEGAITCPDGGVILIGHTTALIPVRVINELNKSIQWHFFELNDAHGKAKYRPIHTLAAFWKHVPKERLLEGDLEKLKGPAFVGWHYSVSAKLGTDDAVVSPGYSGLPSVSLFSINTGASTLYGGQVGFSWVQIQVQKIYNRGNRMCAVRHTPSRTLKSRLEALYAGRLFIYDEGHKVAWLCSTIDLVILAMRLYLKENDSTNTFFSFPHRIPSTQGDKTSLQKLLAAGLDGVSIHTDVQSSQTLGSLLTEISVRYQFAFSRLDEILPRKPNEIILGFDLLDLVKEKIGGQFYPRKLRAQGGIENWSAIVEYNDVVSVIISVRVSSLTKFRNPPFVVFSRRFRLREIFSCAQCIY